MAGPARVVHYLNQFFGGVGGEEQANLPVEAREGPVGPARALQQLMGERGTVVATIVCGDNYINERMESALSTVKRRFPMPDPTWWWRGRPSTPGATAWHAALYARLPGRWAYRQ